MRDFFSVFLRFLAGWAVAFLILCVISVIRYWDVLVRSLSESAEVILEGGFTIFLTVFAIVIMVRAVFNF